MRKHQNDGVASCVPLSNYLGWAEEVQRQVYGMDEKLYWSSAFGVASHTIAQGVVENGVVCEAGFQFADGGGVVFF